MSPYIGYIFVMAGVTYLIRMLPIALFQKEIKSKFLKSFLFYIPYAVLGAMTFPAIFTSGGAVIPSCVGCIVAVIMAYRGKGLVSVALCACIAVYICNFILSSHVM